MVSATSQISKIRRILKPISLLTHESLVEKIDIEIPDLYECASRVLKTQMYSADWDSLISHLDIVAEKRNTVVTFTSLLGINNFNCMIAKVRSKYEKTLKTTILYTDDEEFNLDNLKIIKNQKDFDRIDSGEICYINPKKTYVIKTRTLEEFSGVREIVNDIVFYIPPDSLFEI